MDRKMRDNKLWKITILLMEDVESLMSKKDNITVAQLLGALKKKYTHMIAHSSSSSSSNNAPQELPSMARTTAKKRTSTLKRGRSSETERNKKAKKKKIMDGPDPPPDMPRMIRDKIKNALGGGDPMLILQKTLTESDLNKNQNRLSIPINQLESTEFLEEAEKAQASKRLEGGRIEGLEVKVIEPRCEINTKVILKKWDLNNCSSYMLTGSGYSALVARNRLRSGRIIQVWFFRDALRSPCFAIVNLDHDYLLQLH